MTEHFLLDETHVRVAEIYATGIIGALISRRSKPSAPSDTRVNGTERYLRDQLLCLAGDPDYVIQEGPGNGVAILSALERLHHKYDSDHSYAQQVLNGLGAFMVESELAHS
jgi:hypothetical protein